MQSAAIWFLPADPDRLRASCEVWLNQTSIDNHTVLAAGSCGPDLVVGSWASLFPVLLAFAGAASFDHAKLAIAIALLLGAGLQYSGNVLLAVEFWLFPAIWNPQHLYLVLFVLTTIGCSHVLDKSGSLGAMFTAMRCTHNTHTQHTTHNTYTTHTHTTHKQHTYNTHTTHIQHTHPQLHPEPHHRSPRHGYGGSPVLLR